MTTHSSRRSRIIAADNTYRAAVCELSFDA